MLVIQIDVIRRIRTKHEVITFVYGNYTRNIRVTVFKLRLLVVTPAWQEIPFGYDTP